MRSFEFPENLRSPPHGRKGRLEFTSLPYPLLLQVEPGRLGYSLTYCFSTEGAGAAEGLFGGTSTGRAA